MVRPRLEQSHVMLIGEAVLRRAETRIAGCKTDRPDEADIPLDWLLDDITGCDPAVTD